MIEKKYLIILSIGLSLLFIIGAFVSYLLNKEPKAVLNTNKIFVETWGTYNYQNIRTYPEKVRPLITKELYDDIFGEEMARTLRENEIIDEYIESKTTFRKVLKNEKLGKEYRVVSQISLEQTKAGVRKTEIREIEVIYSVEDTNILAKKVSYN